MLPPIATNMTEAVEHFKFNVTRLICVKDGLRKEVISLCEATVFFEQDLQERSQPQLLCE